MEQNIDMQEKVETEVSSGSIKRKLHFEDGSNKRVCKNSYKRCEEALVNRRNLAKKVVQRARRVMQRFKIKKTHNINNEDNARHCENKSFEHLKLSKFGLNPMVKAITGMSEAPHYEPLNGMSEEFRKPIIAALEAGFLVAADQIRGLAAAKDVRGEMGKISNQLMFLESMGFEVGQLKFRLDGLGRLAQEKLELYEAIEKLGIELKELIDRREALHTSNCFIDSIIALKREELQLWEEKSDTTQSEFDLNNAKQADIQEELNQQKRRCRWLDSEIENQAQLPW